MDKKEFNNQTDNIKNQYNEEHLNIVKGLFSALEQQYLYNNYERLYAEASECVENARKRALALFNRKRLSIFLQEEYSRNKLTLDYNNINIEEVEAKIKEYEQYIDEKYWDVLTLLTLEQKLKTGSAENIEQAITQYEEENQGKRAVRKKSGKKAD